jgi:hypothetical protein
MSAIRSVVLAAIVLLYGVPAFAQQVRSRGYGQADLDEMIQLTLASRPLIIVRDTVIGARDTIPRSVLVLSARFILDGTIVGNLTGVDANMYVRPNAVVTGSVTNIAGGFYPSERAKTGGVEDRPLAPYRVVRRDQDYVIEGTVKFPALKLLGGFQMPEYNRVDGLHAELGPAILLPPAFGVEPIVRGSIGYATEREEVLGRAQLELKRGRSSLIAGWEDDLSQTNDEWIRATLTNSVSSLWNGKDYRDYYQADRVFLEFQRVLERGSRTSRYWIRGQNELSRALVEGDPFVVWKPDSVRFNLPVPKRRITSMFIGAQSEWVGASSAWDISGEIEVAAKVQDADAVYKAYQARVDYAMRALANHTLSIEANFRGPLPGTEDLPLQRWTFVGGSGTLYTFPVAQFRGDRLAFFETDYRIPFARPLKVPLLGRPALRLMHNIGMAWSRSQEPEFEQNIGARLQFPFAFVRVVTNPEHFGDQAEFTVGVTLPDKAYPWEKSARIGRR